MKKYHSAFYIPKERLEYLSQLSEKLGLNLRSEKIFIYNKNMEKRPFKKFVVTYHGNDWDVVYIPKSPHTWKHKLALVRENEYGEGECIYINSSFVFVERFLNTLHKQGLNYSI